MVAFRPNVQFQSYRPRLAPVPSLPPKMSQALSGPEMGQYGYGAVGSLVGVALGAGTAWVGYTVGTGKSGFLMVTGWVVGILGAVGAVAGTVGFFRSL